MKKILCITISTVLILLFLCSCGNKRQWMNYDMSDYIKLADYSNLSVDRNSEEFQKCVTEINQSNLSNASLTGTETISDGSVISGDTTNIAFEGKVDGQVFEGGASESYDLQIGSNSFIPGFEDGVIGMSVGETKDLNLKFPDTYKKSPDLAGKDVVFTVTVNSISRITYPEITEEIALKLGSSNLDDYNSKVFDNAKTQYFLDYMLKNSEVLKYPDKELQDMVNEAKNYYTSVASQSGYTFESYLQSGGMTVEDFEKTMIDSAKSGYVESYMLYYAVVDDNNLYSSDSYDTYIKKLADQASTDVDTIKKNYTAVDIERFIYTNLASDFLSSKLIVK